MSVSATVEPTSLIDTSNKASTDSSVGDFNPKSLTKDQIDEYCAAAEVARPVLVNSERPPDILPEYVYFKNPAGRYLTRIPNQIGWFGLKWDKTNPDNTCRFRITQVSGKMYVSGDQPEHQLDVSFYKVGNYDADVSKGRQVSNSDRHKFHIIWLGNNDIYLGRSALYDQPNIFLSNSNNVRYKLWDHNNSSWLDCVRSNTYGGNDTKITFERAVVRTEVFNVQYNINEADLVNLDPSVAVTKTYENKSESENSQSVDYSYTRSKEGNWNNTAGVEIGTSYTFSAGIPLIAEASGTISIGASSSHSWGGSTMTSETISTNTYAVVPPRSICKVTVFVHHTRMNIPFTYTLKTYHYDGKIEEVRQEGLYRDVQFLKVHAVTEIIGRV